MRQRVFLSAVVTLVIASFACNTVPFLAHATQTPVPPTATLTATSTARPSRTATPTITDTQEPTETSTPEASPLPTEEQSSGQVAITWFVGLGTGSDPAQVGTEVAVVDKFNASQNQIHLTLQIVKNEEARDTLKKMIAAGSGPDIIGPVGWSNANPFEGQWLDLAPYIRESGFDTTQFNPALINMLDTEQGQIALPFAVYPSSIIYNTKLFDENGLNYPPARYGQKYKMPDGTQVEWNWNTVRDIARLLTVDGSGRNATEAGFTKNNINNYGFTWQFEMHPNYWGSYWAGGSMLAPGGSTGHYKAQIPNAWKAAWEWTYDGMWGDQPFMGDASAESSSQLGSGNPFNSDQVAMTIQPIWYTCCVMNLRNWDVAAMPAYNGKVGGRVDQDSFRIWKGTKHPVEAFQVLAYLVTGAVQDLIIGSKSRAPAYGAVPALTIDQEAWVTAKKTQFSWVKNWDVVLAGLNYPDIPSAEGYIPNFEEAWYRGDTFTSLLRTTSGLNLAQEEQIYTDDLTLIFNK
jgi:multiple sugar transport system substrate-binding protein